MQWFMLTVMTMHNAAIDIFKMSGHWSDRSDHVIKYDDFFGMLFETEYNVDRYVCVYANM